QVVGLVVGQYGRERERAVRRQQQPDRLGRVVERGRFGRVHVYGRDDARVILEEQPERQHADDTCRVVGPSTELGPAAVLAKVRRVEDGVLDDRIDARSALELVLDLVDLGDDLGGRRVGLERAVLTLGDA